MLRVLESHCRFVRIASGHSRREGAQPGLLSMIRMAYIRATHTPGHFARHYRVSIMWSGVLLGTPPHYT